jgi:hypothetical protein
MLSKKLAISMVLFLAMVIPAHAAKYAGEFLSLGVGARPISLGGAYVAEWGDVVDGYYNPAGLAGLRNPQAIFMHAETFGSLLNHDYLAYGRPLGADENHAAMAVSFTRLGGGGIIVTGRDETGRIYKISEESHADYAGYFSYGRNYGPNFQAGASAKLIYRDIVDETAFGIGLDLGAIYSPSNWASFGLNMQDITTTLLSYSTGTKESIYPTAKLGGKFSGTKGRFAGTIYADADMKFEGRDYAAQMSAGQVSADSHLGLEISYFNKIAARIGSDAGNLTLGAGLNFSHFGVDLAMRDHAELDNTFLVSLTAGF